MLRKNLAVILSIFFLLAGTCVPLFPVKVLDSAYVEPALLTGEKDLQAIIVTAESTATASRAVMRLGGTVTGRLWLIDGVAAQFPSGQLQALASSPGIYTLTLDKAVFPAADFPTDSPYALDDRASERRVRLYRADLPFPGDLGSPLVALPDNGVFALQKDGEALIANPDGSLRASFTLPSDPYDTPAVVGPDGVIYASGKNDVHAINPDGTPRWDYHSVLELDAGIALYPGGDLLYVVNKINSSHYVLGINTITGTVRFTTPLAGDPNHFLAPPAVDDQGAAYLVNEIGTLYKLGPSGVILWSVSLPGEKPFALSPQVGPAGVIYVVSQKGQVTAINTADGSQVYTFYQPDSTLLEPLAIASDGSVYGAFGSRHVIAINPDGSLKFDFTQNSHTFTYEPQLTLDEAQVIVAAKEKQLFALDAQTGLVNWQFDTDDGADLKDNPVIASNGMIHIGDYKGNYYILNTAGLRLYKYGDFKSFKASPTLAADGTVFFHEDDKEIITLLMLPTAWDGMTPDVQPTNDETIYRLLDPVTVNMGADILHENDIDGSGVTVAVVDSGVYFDNKTRQVLGEVVEEHFLGQVDFVLTESECLASGGSWVAAEAYCLADEKSSWDGFGHGSHVAGIIWNNMTDYNTGVMLGVAPDAHLLSVRVLGDRGGGLYSTVIRGIQHVVAHKDSYSPAIRVLNLSLCAASTTPYFADPLNKAVQEAWAAGIVVVAAAGNTGPGAETITVPGNSPYVITVGAVDTRRTPGYWADDTVATWSATGPTYDGFFKPDVLAPGSNVVSYMYNGDGEIPYIVQIHPDYSENTSLFRMNGTSMAAAAASGAAALLLEHDPALTPDQVKFRLVVSAHPTVNEYGEMVDNIFQQGAGRIWAPMAVYGSFPPDGRANVNMDLSADLANGWDTPEALAAHYEGNVRKMLSDDGSVYLYYVDSGDGTALALGAATATGGQWLAADELDDLAEVQPGGQMIWAGGQMVWAGGQMVWAGGQMVWAGGQMVWAGGQMVWAGGQMVWAGGQMIWAGGQMIWAGRPYWVDGDLLAARDDEYWIEAELTWSGDEPPWDGGFLTWDGEENNPNNTFTYTDTWVNDDGTVIPPPQFTVLFLPAIR